jgi:glycosyltransferase involved in cell wall biosynthesis
MVVAALAGALARRPVVWHLRDLLTADHFGASQRRLATAVANRFVARVIANSRATAEAFIAAGGRPELVTVVYNGIDPAPFEAVTEANLDRLRGELGLNGAPTVGVFSRLAPWKGQHVLLEALVDLPDVHALFVGDELFGADEGYGSHLRARAAGLGVDERAHFLGFRRDVPALMRLVDVVAHTSTAPEPFGRVIVEAMLAGTPVVATDAGGASELIEQGRTGVLIPPDDAPALREALDCLQAAPTFAVALTLEELSATGARVRASPSVDPQSRELTGLK